MPTRLTADSRLWTAVLILVALVLVPLAALQYRWIGEIAQAERERRQAHLRAAVEGFAREFDEQMGRIFRTLVSEPQYPVQPSLLMDPMIDARLVRNFYLAEADSEGGYDLFAYESGTGRLLPAAWPKEFEPLRERMRAPVPVNTLMPGRGGVPVDDSIPALIAPRMRYAPSRFDGPFMSAWAVAEIDRAYLTDQFLPALVKRHFASEDDAGFALRIVSARDGAPAIYATDPGLPDDFFVQPDAEISLFELRFGPPPGVRGGPPPRAWERPPGPWRLQARHRAGSLEQAVAQTRLRNLAVSFGVLLLMAASLAALLLSTRRAQRLARLQMEFVAGVSHELKTPLSVICSAGDNLAEGVVHADDQVRRYGAVIRGEGRRLSRMIEQILRFAGLQSGQVRLNPEPVEVAELLHRAAETCDPEIRAAGCTLETRIDDGLPRVTADPALLAHALRNLLDNAATHGARGQWIGLTARLIPANGAGVVEVVVEDRGPGLPASELNRVFEPFYRGRRAIEDQTRGFGLGLALARRIVEAHSGSLTVESALGQGTRFTLRLPVSDHVADG